MRIRFLLQLLLLLAGIAFLTGGCAARQPAETDDQLAWLSRQDYDPARRADNFLLLLDASSSMVRPYTIGTGFEVTGQLAAAFNELTPELPWRSGLRVFGPVSEVDGVLTNTELLRAPAPHDRAEMARDLARLAGPAGSTPLAKALAQAGRDLADLPGRSVILLMTDGEVRFPEQVLAAAAGLEREFGERLCIFPVFLGATAADEELLQQVVQIAGGGRMVRGTDFFRAEVLAHERVGYLSTVNFWQDLLLDRQQVADFVAATLLEQCPSLTAADPESLLPAVSSAPAEEESAPVPALPELAREEIGSHLVIYFAFDRTEISSEDQQALDQLGRFLQEDREATILVEGHTDSRGSAVYNQRLSQRRATVVVSYLLDHFGIEPRRIHSRGYGYNRPAADNSSAEGRRLNRRTEVVVTIISGQQR